jgi:prepilin-type processing-associated H-X9-DG protein
LPAMTISFIEEPDPRKGLMGSWVTDVYSVGAWVDPVGFWHDKGANFCFLDGHTEYWRWTDARTLLIKYAFYAVTPNNPDDLRIKRHLYPGDPDGRVW